VCDDLNYTCRFDGIASKMPWLQKLRSAYPTKYLTLKSVLGRSNATPPREYGLVRFGYVGFRNDWGWCSINRLKFSLGAWWSLELFSESLWKSSIFNHRLVRSIEQRSVTLQESNRDILLLSE
jgi:hypothetical protein